ncbi:barstar family protein [Deinococcus maricopensis]|uniref:Barstar (Barnase inhibitor) n=1 Tax=Deinococcus maricopensis (strain DSM 21211 / LMG 22137 / NRRL B-23946 / LB-34) TaxID=709986 RepID=E8U921_DEIML|nr:barstar family protein [Deinococcus maricopensis]ADV67560.1 Barstar (barnase inhibitor) [Deinococcus maricopensis DSM 21211]
MIVLDVSRARGRADLMRAARRDLPLPGYFGDNWDALADVLCDAALWPDGATLTVRGLAAFEHRSPDMAALLRDVLRDACLPVVIEDER